MFCDHVWNTEKCKGTTSPNKLNKPCTVHVHTYRTVQIHVHTHLGLQYAFLCLENCHNVIRRYADIVIIDIVVILYAGSFCWSTLTTMIKQVTHSSTGIRATVTSVV
jgi:hypothetical protein